MRNMILRTVQGPSLLSKKSAYPVVRSFIKNAISLAEATMPVLSRINF